MVTTLGGTRSAFNGVKVFAATTPDRRRELGERVTAWVADHADAEIVEIAVRQSSDYAFHCVTIVVFYVEGV
jgi:hypothetical protein